MKTEVLSPKVEPKLETQEIHKSLIYEEIDGVPFYYKGWQNVLNHQQTLAEIMGCLGTQVVIISCILEFLYQNLSLTDY